ncbi:hypothetical protein TRAPUB_7276 [Trametes pubescens]|uniref:Uncharacterized protein n=1 Tax=Trametes pubescens TaxID=154538 RepID=A0A1M2V3I5_TRAPU|nr:hypothetical protein TRAPUB_7276 [Trametes pubescens]
MKNARRSSNRFVAIDAQDPEIVYEGAWQDATVDQDEGSSAKSTVSPDGSATASYIFHGIAIYMYGYIAPFGPPTPQIICYLDDAPFPVTFPNAEDQIQSYWDSTWPLCWYERLTDGNHTFKLVVDSATKSYPFILESLEFRISRQQYANLAGSLEANVAANASSSATSSSSTSNGSATATSESHGVSAAPIVGGVLGAVLGLGLMALGIYLVVRRRRQAYSKLVDEDLRRPKIIPFMIGSSRRPPTHSTFSYSPITESGTAFEAQDPSTVAATFNPSPLRSTSKESQSTPQVEKHIKEQQSYTCDTPVTV